MASNSFLVAGGGEEMTRGEAVLAGVLAGCRPHGVNGVNWLKVIVTWPALLKKGVSGE